MKINQPLFEFEDLDWFPATIREGMTDYLRYMLTIMNFYEPVTALLVDGLAQTNSDRIVDLCSGGGGAIEQVKKSIRQQSKQEVLVTLTDKFPNEYAFEFLSGKTNGSISFLKIPVDACNVPAGLRGFRTIFSGFHHFDETLARAVIKNAVDAKAGIGIFDGGDRNILVILAMLIVHPLAFIVLTPFFKPFRFSRIIFTYIIPLIPLCTIWDGIVSIIRLHDPEKLLKMAREIESTHYTWKAGKLKNKLGLKVAYLAGYPAVPVSIE